MKKRIDEINVLRAFACLSVVLVHISAIPVSTLRRSYVLMGFTVLNRAVKYTTPAFIFMSGLLLVYIYKDREFNYFKFLKKRLKSTLIPYFIWTVIYYAYFIKRGYYVFSLEFFMENLLLGKMSFHLYFIVTITQFYFLFGLIRYLFRKYNPHILLVGSFVINVLVIKYVHFKYTDRFFLQYIFFFTLGGYISIYIESFKAIIKKYKYPILLGHGGIVAYYAYQYYQYQFLQRSVDGFIVNMTWFIFSFISIVSLYGIAVWVTNRYKLLYKGFKEVSKASYYIYLSHPLVLTISNSFLKKVGILSISLRFVLNLIIVTGTVVSIAIIYTRIKETYFRNKKKRQVSTAK